MIERTDRHLRAVPALDDEFEPSLPPVQFDDLPARRRRATRARKPPSRGTALARVAILLVASGAAAALLAPRLVRGDLPVDAALIGTPARAFVRADRDYALVDAEATAALRADAEQRNRPVWDLDTSQAQRDQQALHKGLVRLTVALEPARAQVGGQAPRDGAVPRAVLAAAEPVRAVIVGELSLLGIEAPRDDAWRALVRALWLHPPAVDVIHEILTEAGTQPTVVQRSELMRDGARGIVVRPVPAVPGAEQVREDVHGVLDVASARAAVAARLSAALLDAVPPLGQQEAHSISGFAAGLVRATLTPNAAESDIRRRREAEKVPPVIVRARRGEIVLRPGETITARHHLLARAMGVQQADDMRTRAQLGTALFVGLVCLVVYLFGARRVFRRSLRSKDLVFLAAMLLVELFSIVAADALGPFLPAALPPAVASFAIPVALGAMIVRLMLTPDVALLFALVASMLGAVVVEPGLHFAVVGILSSLTGAAGVSYSQRRRTMLLAGVGAGLVGAFAALTLELFRGALVGGDLLWLVGSTFAGGVLSGVLVVIVTPMVELVFGYVTEQRLSRFADLNHPILKDLIVHAPGTWHHSVRTAELAEAAARAVGARVLLARVMALYHDIGKMTKPQLFLENQKKGDNPHERLPAEQSAEALRNHVAEGLRIALERGVPRQIAAAIEEHHADNLMEGFFAKALNARGDESAPIDERAFRYAGQLPQSRESALVMLADQLESAARSLEDPSPERLCDLVERFVQKALAEGTLDECDLSLKDIGRAREALQRGLLSLTRQEKAS